MKVSEILGIDPNDKYYPGANGWMWNYCIFLGKFKRTDGKECDLGIHINKHEDGYTEISDATVWSDEPGDYSSGEISQYMWDSHDCFSPLKEAKREVYRRAKLAGLIDINL